MRVLTQQLCSTGALPGVPLGYQGRRTRSGIGRNHRTVSTIRRRCEPALADLGGPVLPGQLRTIQDATGSSRDRCSAGGRMITAWVALVGTVLGGYDWIRHSAARVEFRKFTRSYPGMGYAEGARKAQSLRQGLLAVDVIKLCPGEFTSNRVFVDRYRYCLTNVCSDLG